MNTQHTDAINRKRWIIALWFIALFIAAVTIVRSPFLADMSIFLPRSPDAAQSVLARGMTSGTGARSLLIAVSGVPRAERATVSSALAKRWESLDGVAAALNGRQSSLAADENLLFDARYLLASEIDARTFDAPALREAIERSVGLLRSGFGLFAKDKILRDPTGHAAQLFDSLSDENRPRTEHGVWVTRDASALLFIVRTTIDGTDLDAQERLISLLRAAFDEVRAQSQAEMTISGPSVFAVQSRNMIRGDVIRLSTVGVGLIVLLLGFVFRSLPAILLTLVPMITAVTVGAATVSLVFGALHGLTLGFGAALIGETVDYAIYHLSSSRGNRARVGLWAPVRLGVMTSIVGFAMLLFSGFPGLAQLAVFAISGLLAGYLVARWVLPELTPSAFAPRSLAGVGRVASRLMGFSGATRVGIGLLAVAAVVFSVSQRERLWDTDIAALNPIAKSAQAMDQVLRESLGEQGARVLVMINAADETSALEATHQATNALERVAKKANAAGYSSPTQILKPPSVQIKNQAALPEPNQLATALAAAAIGQQLSAKRFEQFASDVQQTRNRAPMTMADFDGSQTGTRLRTLLLPETTGFSALIPISDPSTGQIDVAQIRLAMPTLVDASISVVDLKAQANNLYGGYLREAIFLSALGGIAIALLLGVALRSPARLLTIAVPVVAALAVVMSLLVLLGQSLHLLHLVGLLLVAAVGSNYALVVAQFARNQDDSDPATLGALCVANATTLCGYGVLAASSVPLLSALGMTVGMGAPLVLLLALLWTRPDRSIAT